MIHVATVHWRDDRWVDLQLSYLERYAAEPYRVYAFLTSLERDHSARFFYSSTEPIRPHAIKLNLLADLIAFAAGSPDDLLLFLDGDAFPVNPLGPLMRERLERTPFVAVRRDENGGSPFPHPSFAFTTVGFWQEIGGTWAPGDRQHWTDPSGQRGITDVGANLLTILKDRGIAWEPLLRSNARNLHPLYYAVYGDAEEPAVLYHHGAGFTPHPGRALMWERGEVEARETLQARILDRLPNARWAKRVRRRYHPAKRLRRQLSKEVGELDREVFAKIEADPEFWRELL